MKKFLLGLIICLLSLSAFAGEYVEETLVRAPIKRERRLLCGDNQKPIRVAGFMNYPPFGWKEMVKNDRNQDVAAYFGIGAELFKKFAKEYDLVYQYTNLLNYREAVYALQAGYFDILLTDFYVPNSYSSIRYIYPGYILNPIVIVSLKPSSEKVKIPQTLEDLKGKTGYVRSEENIYQLFHTQIPKDIKIKQVTGAKRAFYGLLKKEVDFLLMSQYAFETEVRRFKIKDYVTYSQKPVFAPYIFMSYSQNNSCARYIKKVLENKVKEYTSNEMEIKKLLTSQLVNWENKFIHEPSLMFETGVPEEEVEEVSGDLDAWLKSEQEKQKTSGEKPAAETTKDAAPSKAVSK